MVLSVVKLPVYKTSGFEKREKSLFHVSNATKGLSQYLHIIDTRASKLWRQNLLSLRKKYEYLLIKKGPQMIVSRLSKLRM